MDTPLYVVSQSSFDLSISLLCGYTACILCVSWMGCMRDRRVRDCGGGVMLGGGMLRDGV